MAVFRKCIHGVKLLKLAPNCNLFVYFRLGSIGPQQYSLRNLNVVFGLKSKSCHIWITNIIGDNVLKEGCTVLCSSDVIPEWCSGVQWTPGVLLRVKRKTFLCISLCTLFSVGGISSTVAVSTHIQCSVILSLVFVSLKTKNVFTYFVVTFISVFSDSVQMAYEHLKTLTRNRPTCTI